MSRYPDYDAPSSATDWVMNTARRNPEGLLLLAAGCALLMRSGASPLAKRFSENSYGGHANSYGGNADGGHRGSASHSTLREGISRTAEGAADYVSDVKDKVAETAGSYMSSVTDYADETRRNISDQSARLTRQAQSTLQSGMDRMLREQPLAVAILGVAAGAAVASLFPTTDVEQQALGGTRDALVDAASKAGESLAGAAGAAGERLMSTAAERGLNPEGLKEIARDVADTFTTAVAGKPGEERSPATSGGNQISGKTGSANSPSMAPRNSQPGGSSGSSSSTPSLAPGNNQPGGNRGGR
jgi:hypothetical protein